MPASTPLYGITYPCLGETVTAADFQTFAEQVDDVCCAADRATQDLLTFPRARVQRFQMVTPTFPQGVATDITWNQEVLDNDTMADLAVNADRLTVATPGVYVITADIGGFGGIAGVTSFSLLLTQNGTVVYGRKFKPPVNSSGVFLLTDLYINAGGLLQCAAADVIRAQFLWTGAGGPATDGTGALTARLVVAL